MTVVEPRLAGSAHGRMRYWTEFREGMESFGSLPKYVERDVDEYLRCGILEDGFIRVPGTDCGFDRIVALIVDVGTAKKLVHNGFTARFGFAKSKRQ
jgi:hypothetical protein